MEDKVLKRLVEDELEWDPSIDATGIGVSVERGIVNLTGHVGNYAELFAAEKAVKRIKGVRGYAQDIEVRLAADAESDTGIAGKVANIIDWDITIPKGSVQVKVRDGFVTLTGAVEWAFQRIAAESGLRHLAGVRGVTNMITVKPRLQARDIKRRIEQALDRRADETAHAVTVTVKDDKVFLDGKLPTWAEREAIEHAAWGSPGVTAVEDRTTIGV